MHITNQKKYTKPTIPTNDEYLEVWTFKNSCLTEGDCKSNLYFPIKLIGSGSIGNIFMANAFGGYPCAIKRFKTTDAHLIDLSLDGHKHLKNISSPYLMKISGIYSEPRAISMELLNGTDANSIRYDLKINDIISIMHDICKALELLNVEGLVHRDIKPSNIFLIENNPTKLVDYDMLIREGSKQKKGVILGTPLYMSPEQVAGKSLNHKSDIYSLAISIFELILDTKFPQAFFTEGTVNEVFNARIRNRMNLPLQWCSNIPKWLLASLLSCVSMSPDNRPTAVDLIDIINKNHKDNL